RGPRRVLAVLFVIALLTVLPAVIRPNLEDPLPAEARETSSRSPAIPETPPTAGPQAPASLGWLAEWKRPAPEATTAPAAAPSIAKPVMDTPPPVKHSRPASRSATHVARAHRTSGTRHGSASHRAPVPARGGPSPRSRALIAPK